MFPVAVIVIVPSAAPKQLTFPGVADCTEKVGITLGKGWVP